MKDMKDPISVVAQYVPGTLYVNQMGVSFLVLNVRHEYDGDGRPMTSGTSLMVSKYGTEIFDWNQWTDILSSSDDGTIVLFPEEMP